MVGSINNGFQQQPPIAMAFKPSEQTTTQQQNKADSGNQSAPALNASQKFSLDGANKTQDTTAKSALSSDNTRPDPTNISSSVNRGSALDILA